MRLNGTCVIVLLTATVILCGACALRPVVPYDTAEKVLLGTAVGGQVWDYTSTRSGLDAGCIETNPILGEHPSDGALIASKVLVSCMAWLGANAMPNHLERKAFLGVISIIGIAAGAHNSQVDCR